MTLLQFIRLIMQHLKLLIIVPVIMVTMVFFLTQNPTPTFKSSTTVYTGFASGYTIETGENSRFDYQGINIAFDNLMETMKSRETREEVALKLLTTNLLADTTLEGNKTISAESHQELAEWVPSQIREQVVVMDDFDETYRRLDSMMRSNTTNHIYILLNSDNAHYGIVGLLGVKVSRLKNSDMIKLDFESDDAGICYNTLEILTSTFVSKYRDVKKGETNSVVQYFQNEVNKAQDKLDAAEARLQKFREDNKIINYYEQTKFISEQKEDLENEYQNELMKLASNIAAIENIDAKLTEKDNMLLNSKTVLDQRNKLISISTKLAQLESQQLDSTRIKEIAELTQESTRIKAELNQSINNLYASNVSVEGIHAKELVKLWLEHQILKDESEARILLYENRKKDFDITYSHFAPLGSTVKKMEREIAVAEKEYLAMLASLNSSKLKQQNIELSNNLSVLDSPFYPTEPEATKRKLLIVAAGFVGLILTLAMIILLEYLDKSIKTPQRIMEITGTTLAGGLPNLKKVKKEMSPLFIDGLSQQVINHINTQLKLREAYTRPHLVVFFSTREGEGKSFISNLLSEKLRDSGYKALMLQPKSEEQPDSPDFIGYEVPKNFSITKSVEELIEEPRDLSQYDYILLEIPAIISGKKPLNILSEADLSILVVRAGRSWNTADGLALNNFKLVSQYPPEIILNETRNEALENIIGFSPKKRSRLRVLVKKWVTQEFNVRSN